MKILKKITCFPLNPVNMHQVGKKQSRVLLYLVDKVHLLNFDGQPPLFFDYDVVVSEIFKSQFRHFLFFYPVFLLDGSGDVFDTRARICFRDVLVFLRVRSTTHTIPL